MLARPRIACCWAGLLLECVLAPGTLYGQVHNLVGTVADSVGTTVSDARVEVAGSSILGRTDALGRFRLTGITRDTVVLSVEKVGFTSRRLRVAISPDDEPDVPIGTIRLRPADRKLISVKATARERDSKRPIEGVMLVLNDRSLAYTGPDGTLTAPKVQVFSGLNVAAVRRIGYQPIEFDLWVPEGQMEVALALNLKPAAVRLAEVVVEGDEVRVRYPWMEGFERRVKLGHGDFLTEERIQRVRGFDALGLLRWLPKHSVWLWGDGLSGARIQILGAHCGPPVYFINGIQLEEVSALDRLSMLGPDDVQGVEVYSHAGGIPPEFNTTGAACGVIAFWIRP